ncbi:hypothetical protein TrRE_jg1600 [Triparma retinervis]|uniref:MBD domain-containing protein n=1 Tax=Triparma retinervis TaxID=2557542 RepID=A0A9W7A820_9STRA|nr:hypothetical protein TrRE_jg1600 [Triparma retinervis]
MSLSFVPDRNFNIQEVLQRDGFERVPGSSIGCDDTWIVAYKKVPYKHYEYYIEAPSGRRFTKKKVAVKHFKEEQENSRAPTKAEDENDARTHLNPGQTDMDLCSQQKKPVPQCLANNTTCSEFLQTLKADNTILKEFKKSTIQKMPDEGVKESEEDDKDEGEGKKK